MVNALIEFCSSCTEAIEHLFGVALIGCGILLALPFSLLTAPFFYARKVLIWFERRRAKRDG